MLDVLLEKLEKGEMLEDFELQYILHSVAVSLKSIAERYGA